MCHLQCFSCSIHLLKPTGINQVTKPAFFIFNHPLSHCFSHFPHDQRVIFKYLLNVLYNIMQFSSLFSARKAKKFVQFFINYKWHRPSPLLDLSSASFQEVNGLANIFKRLTCHLIDIKTMTKHFQQKSYTITVQHLINVPWKINELQFFPNCCPTPSSYSHSFSLFCNPLQCDRASLLP